MATWQADIKIRRNGRLVKREISDAESAKFALYWASNDLERWCDDQEPTP